MQIETIEELAGILSSSSLTRLELMELEGDLLTLERAAPLPVVAVPSIIETGARPVEIDTTAPAQDVVAVEAPMVGVFHEAAPPVAVGQAVRAGDVLGAIEALALRNEVRAPLDGSVVSISVEDGQPVEYGQPMFTLGRPEGSS